MPLIEESQETAQQSTKYTKKATHARMVNAILSLNEVVIERETEIMLTYCAIISGNNCLYFGTPGEAKSKMARHILDSFDLRTYHNTLFQGMDPDELIGGTILSAMVDGSTRRALDKGFCMADLAFLDEIGKAPDSLMTTIMTALNERTITNDGEIVHLPLQSVIAASNEETCQVAGLFDRFPVKIMVNPPSRAARKRITMMQLKEDETRQRTVFNDALKISKGLLLAARASSKTITMSEEIVDLYHSLADGCETVMPVSTRKRYYGVEILKAYKYLLNGADKEIDIACMSILPHIFCDIPSQIPDVKAVVKNFMDCQSSSM